MKKLIVLYCFATLLVVAEPSVYSDADFIDVESVAKKNSREIFRLKQKIANLSEQIEGLKTLLNSQENQIARLKQKTNNNYTDIINKLAQKIAELENRLNNQQYTPKTTSTPQAPKELALKEQNQTPPTFPKELKKEKKLSNKELYKQAVLDFSNKRYTSAKKLFQKLLLEGYKPAESNFYLGEIAFYRKKYKDAISSYQNSATLNEDALYMDKLLLHTAIALQKIGKRKEAKSFFQAIVDSYPNTPSAKEAKKYLK